MKTTERIKMDEQDVYDVLLAVMHDKPIQFFNPNSGEWMDTKLHTADECLLFIVYAVRNLLSY